MATPTPVIVNPLVPPGSESLRQGDDRIRDLAKWLLQVLGLPYTGEQTFLSPFAVGGSAPPTTLPSGVVEVYADPTTDMGIATSQFAARKVLYADVFLSGVEYAGSTTPATRSPSPNPAYQYDINAVYIIAPNVTNSGAVNLRLNSGPSFPFNHVDGSALVAGELSALSPHVVVFEGNSFRLQAFGGGNVPGATTFAKAVTLAANPTANLGAAPKQYVDSAVGHPASTPLGSDSAAFGNTATTIMSTVVNTPNDGNSYLIEVDYWMWVETNSGADLQVETWIDANGESFAMSGARLDNTQIVGSTNASGLGVTIYPAATAVTVTLKAISVGGNAKVVQTGAAFPGTPPSTLRVTMLRTTP